MLESRVETGEVLGAKTGEPRARRQHAVLREAALLRHQAALDRQAAAVDRNIAALLRYEAALDLEAARRERALGGVDELTGALQRAAGQLALRHEFERSRRTG